MKRSLFQFAVGLSAALAISVLSGIAQTAQELPAFAAVKRELKTGETHSFRIVLNAGEFLYATVEQQDIDVVTAVFSPDGKQLTESDSPNDRWGSEPIIFVAPVSGEYRVDIRGPRSQVPAGHYEIKIIALRDSNAIDKGHAAAQLLFDEARKLRSQQGAPPKQAAIEKYEQALPLFAAAGDDYRRALTLLSIGTSYYRLSDFRKALDYFNQTLALSIELKDPRLEAGTQTYVGGMLDILGDVGKALDHYQRALKLARESRSVTSARSIRTRLIGRRRWIFTARRCRCSRQSIANRMKLSRLITLAQPTAVPANMTKRWITFSSLFLCFMPPRTRMARPTRS